VKRAFFTDCYESAADMTSLQFMTSQSIKWKPTDSNSATNYYYNTRKLVQEIIDSLKT